VVNKTNRKVGVALAEKWQLPPDVVSGIAEAADDDNAARKSPANDVRAPSASSWTHRPLPRCRTPIPRRPPPPTPRAPASALFLSLPLRPSRPARAPGTVVDFPPR